MKRENAPAISAGAFCCLSARIRNDAPVFASHPTDLLEVARVACHHNHVMGDGAGRNPSVVRADSGSRTHSWS